MDNKALQMHEKWQGKIETKVKASIRNREDLSIAYTPGVAEACKEIAKNGEEIYRYTMKHNTVAIVSDGSAVLGLGNIGAAAALPVMEGKACLFKEFAGIDAFPICLDTQDTEEIIRTVKNIAVNFGGICLEDISAPRCFEIEERLKRELDIPVTHDDQHGTAIVVLAGIINSLRIVKKEMSSCKVVINGAGAAGIAICRHLMLAEFENIILCDKDGILDAEDIHINPVQKKMALFTNPHHIKGDLRTAMKDADIFIGVSRAGLVDESMIASMNKDAIVFAMANPDPEIMPEDAKRAGARIVASGRSDYPNQVNNLLAFPGMFKGSLFNRSQITPEMELAASDALADLIDPSELNEEHIIPDVFDKRVVDAIAQAVIRNK